MRVHITIAPDNPEFSQPYGVRFDVETDTPLVFCKDLAKSIADVLQSTWVADGVVPNSVVVLL